ncbi:MAG: DDE-type integrase/transposase/recombinase [Synechococcus sp.]
MKINVKKYYLWRAVGKHGQGLDILMQTRMIQRAVNKFFRKLLKP